MSDDREWNLISPKELATILCRADDDEPRLLVDSRSFLEFNTCHIRGAINVSFSKMIKRSLQNHQLPVKQLLLLSNMKLKLDEDFEIIVYDQCTSHPGHLSQDCFLLVLMDRLVAQFSNVRFLTGGLIDFQAEFHSLCDTERSLSILSTSSSSPCQRSKCMLSLSQPCMTFSSMGPTRILPFLFLGSQQDALSQEIMKQNGISHILNVSTNGEEPTFLGEGHFLRIPVNDSHNDKLLPYFNAAFQFIDKVREANGCVLVHCLAGISRSPTLAIAYIMKYLGLTCDEAYKYVKDKRHTISPNFNFLGQLLEYERSLKPKSGTDNARTMLTSSLESESFYSEKFAKNSFASQSVGIGKSNDFNSTRPGELIRINNVVEQSFQESAFEFEAATERSTARNTREETKTEENSSSFKISPNRPSTLLHSTSESIPKINFASNFLAGVKPSPISEVSSPVETHRHRNVSSKDNSFRPNLEKGLIDTSSHFDATNPSSHLKFENTSKNVREQIVAISSSQSKEINNSIHQSSASSSSSSTNQKSQFVHHYRHQSSQSHQRAHGQHQNHSGQQRTKIQQHKNSSRRFNHFPKSHLECHPNYNHSPFQRPLYGFPTHQGMVFPYNFSPGGVPPQCFPHFHSNQPPNMYFQQPRSQADYLYFLNFPNYPNSHHHHLMCNNINLQHHPNNLYGSFHNHHHHHQQQQHSFFASNTNNNFYNLPPTSNFVIKEDFNGRMGTTFPNSFQPEPFHLPPRFPDGYRSTHSGQRTERRSAHPEPSNGFSFNDRLSVPSSSDLGMSRTATSCPASTFDDGNLRDSVIEVLENSHSNTSVVAANNLMKEVDDVDPGLGRPSPSLPSFGASGSSLSEDPATRNDKLLHPLKKAPLQLRPNSISLQNVRLKSVAVNDSFAPVLPQVSDVSLENSLFCKRDFSALSKMEFKIAKEQRYTNSKDLIDAESNSDLEKNSFPDAKENFKIGFNDLIAEESGDTFSSKDVYQLGEEKNESRCSSLISSTPNPAANSFRETLSSSASSSSSSRKSRSLEDIIINSSKVLKGACTHVEAVEKRNEKCVLPSSGKRLQIPSASETVAQNNPEKQIEKFKMKIVSPVRRWQSNEDQLETDGVPTNRRSQNSRKVEVLKVS